MNRIVNVERTPIGSGKLVRVVITYQTPQGIKYTVKRYVKG